MSDSQPHHAHPNAELLLSATKGFDYLFSNDIVSAREHFKQRDDPFHLMGLGVCAFLEAALGMESGLMAEATRCLSLSEAGTRKHMRNPKPRDLSHHSRFHHGLEWEILNADAVVLLGLTQALSESYMGYLQCIAHSKFTKLYKTVFPQGLPQPPNFDPTTTVALSPSSARITVSPSMPAALHHKPSLKSLNSESSTSSAASAATIPAPVAPAPAIRPGGFFSRWVGTASTPTLLIQSDSHVVPDGPVEDLIVAGSAFGFGLFNLVFSLLPKKIQGLVGFLGFKHDRKLALQALSLSATKHDVHGVFAGLVLMTYHGVVLLLSGYQANEAKILAEYQVIVDKIATRYPEGALWILNRAKIMRMSYDAEGAILVLQSGLKDVRKHSFAQADMLLIFELAGADAFIRITELNSWSHGTYYFIAAGCYYSLGNFEKAQSLLDAIPDLIDKKKISGKDLPTEVFIKKKLAFYKEKHLRRTGSEQNLIQSVKISPADVWNNHARISPSIAQAHIDILSSLTPPLEASSPTSGSRRGVKSPLSPRSKTSLSSLRIEDDLDTLDELAVRALLLGINYRTIKEFEVSRGFLNEALDYQNAVKVSTWVGGVAAFELAVLDLKEAEEGDPRPGIDRSLASTSSDTSASSSSTTSLTINADATDEVDGYMSNPISEEERKGVWKEALKCASANLEAALNLATSSVDLSSRLDSRIVMLRDEIATKKDMLGLDF
ncbi:hypothetical protein BDZ97DRAFT_1804125 [Flammula alnicola]|nr:hypothetical protein BDZ97DRAFT_1804125 [Flammula alnicola]